jgi:MOSC domain-containing protein YiiM
VGKILSIYTCPDKGQDMCEVQQVQAVTQVGLMGDRYALGRGAWSNSKKVTIRQVSLIATEAITEANKLLLVPFLPQETRRNLLTEGIELNGLVGKCFQVGGVAMRGVELCDPCTRPSMLSKKPDFESAFQQRGGLRAEILSDGIISVGSYISLVDHDVLLARLKNFVSTRCILVFKDGSNLRGRLNYLGEVAEDSGDWFVIVDNGITQTFHTSTIVDVVRARA